MTIQTYSECVLSKSQKLFSVLVEASSVLKEADNLH